MARRSLAILFALLPSTHGHGYLKTPRSRNLYAYQERDWEDGGGKSPYPEDCKYFMRCACIIYNWDAVWRSSECSFDESRHII